MKSWKNMERDWGGDKIQIEENRKWKKENWPHLDFKLSFLLNTFLNQKPS